MRLLRYLLPLGVLALLLLGSWLWMRQYTRHNVTVRVPDVKGSSFDEAQEMLSSVSCGRW